MIIGLDELAVVKDYLARRLGDINPHSLIGIRRRAVRLGVWWRVDAVKRALVDAVIFYVKGGGVVRSPSLRAALRQIAVEVLALMLARRLKLVAYLIGQRLIQRLGWVREVVRGPKDIVSIGLMWMNTPNWYRPDV